MEYKKYVIEGRRIASVQGRSDLRLFVDDAEVTLDETIELGVNHSPTGFAVGFGGSGPSQSSFAILLGASRDKDFAQTLKNDFKWDHVSKYPQHGSFRVEVDLISWAGKQAHKYLNEKHLHAVLARMKKEKGGE